MTELTIIATKDERWYKVKFTKSKAMLNVFKKMGNYAEFSLEQKSWLVHYSKLVPTVRWAKKLFDVVDYSELPQAIQIAIVQGLKDKDTGKAFRGSKSSTAVSAHNKLFVIESAPLEVVKAAYKALSRLHHPDFGGDQAKMAEINEAYSEIMDEADQ